MGWNEEEAKSGLNTLDSIVSASEDVCKSLEAQIELIPITYGEKDELGENTESYLTEIKDSIENDFKGKLEDILSKRYTIIDNARNQDERLRKKEAQSDDKHGYRSEEKTK